MPPPLACPPVGLCLSKGGLGSAEGGVPASGEKGQSWLLVASYHRQHFFPYCQMSVSVSSQVSMATFRVIRLGIGGGWLLGK